MELKLIFKLVLKQRKQLSNQPVTQIMRNMIRTEGLISLVRSFPVTYLMNVPLQGILVGTNETLKVQMQKTFNYSNFISYFLCAGIAGAVAATLTTPLDVVKTKLQTQDIYQKSQSSSVSQINENQMHKSKYQNFLQTFKLILQEEGMRGLFRGFGTRIIMFSPSSAISWATYEVMKKYLLGDKLIH